MVLDVNSGGGYSLRAHPEGGEDTGKDLLAVGVVLAVARVEHAQILRPEDIRKLGEAGLVASVQPTHATSDMGWAEARLGAERLKGAYAWKSLKEAGAVLALGSDFPIEKRANFVLP